MLSWACESTANFNTSLTISCDEFKVRRDRQEITILSATYGTYNSKECFGGKLTDLCYDFSPGSQTNSSAPKSEKVFRILTLFLLSETI
jgi:hypothetical protein